MNSTTEENYLKALFHLSEQHDQITVSDLSQAMDVSMPTVNSMIKKLDAKGWLKYEKYKPLSITTKGKKTAALVIRKHRLTEMFLVKLMGFSWENVHEIAEQIEHVKSELFFDRMDELLGYPTVDPHGSPIPDKEGNVIKQNLRKLSACQAGERVKLTALLDSSKALLQFLNKKDLSLGLEILIISKEDFDGSLIVSYGDVQSVPLSQVVCNNLLVTY